MLSLTLSAIKRAAYSHPAQVNVLVAFITTKATSMLIAPSEKSASMERQRFLDCKYGLSKGCILMFIHNQCIGCHYGQKYC